MKADLFQSPIRMNVAVYEIKQKNILMNANDPQNPDLLVTRGGERSRGIEWDIAGYIRPNWQINASYSYIDAIITNDANESLIGARKQNTPKHSANLWTRYNFGASSPLKDLGIGFGVQQHNILYAPAIKGAVTFSKGDSKVFEINMAPSLLKKYLGNTEIFKIFIGQIAHQNPAMLGRHNIP